MVHETAGKGVHYRWLCNARGSGAIPEGAAMNGLQDSSPMGRLFGWCDRREELH